MQGDLSGNAILLCGGVGRRMGMEIPKQFIPIKGIPIVVYPMLQIEATEAVKQFVAVAHPAWKDELSNLIEQYGIRKCIGVVDAGSTRMNSIYNGATFLKNILNPDDVITIMDGVRPLVTSQIITDNIKAAHKYGAAMAIDGCKDTMYLSQDKAFACEEIHRDNLFKGQTPESSKLGMLLRYIARAKDDGIEDIAPSSMYVHYGKNVALTEGSPLNLKMTTQDDLKIFEALLSLNDKKQ